MSTDKQEQFEQALRECAAEPIHQIGNIQSQGILLVVSAESPYTILQASDNLERFLNLTAQQVLDKSLSDVIGEVALKQVEKLALVAKQKNTAAGTLSIQNISTREIPAHLYFSDEMLVLELSDENDNHRENNLAQLMLKFQESLLSTASDTNLSQYFDEIASVVRALTGHDSVMVYRFDGNWNGEVISQSRIESAPAYLGLHFPASDIPPQARRLYTTNLVRVVADVNAVPVPILPTLNPVTQQPLDLTYSALRSLSPIHIEYLRNIGVGASMVISLMQNGRLWGMIACHHLSPKPISLVLREAAIFISRMVSGKLSSIEALEQTAKVDECHRIVSDLLNYINVDTERNILARLLPELTSLLNATGIIMVVDGKRCLHGTVPNVSALDALLNWLGSQPTSEIFACDQLSKIFPPAAAYAEIAAGILTTPLSKDMSSCIIWLRSEKPRTINWAGNYATGLAQNSAGDYRLTPRKSFDIWTEQWRGRSVSWSNIETGIAGMIALSLPESLAHKLRLEQAEIDRKRSEENALAARIQLEQMTASVPGVVYQFLTTAEGESKFIYISSGIKALYEVAADEAYRNQHVLTDHILPEDRASHRESVERSAAKFSVWDHEYRIRTQSEKFKWVHGIASPQRLSDGGILWSGMLTDITERKQLEEQVRQMAFYDALTHLPNRRMLNDRLDQAIAASKRNACYGALMFLDLDNFKPLNDKHGHVAGDILLMEAANRLKSCIREMDTVARFGGDEFVVMLSEFETDKISATLQARNVAEKILATLSEPYLLAVLHDDQPSEMVEYHCTASIGFTVFVNHEGGRDEILKQADDAMYQAKAAGRNSIRFYESKILT